MFKKLKKKIQNYMQKKLGIEDYFEILPDILRGMQQQTDTLESDVRIFKKHISDLEAVRISFTSGVQDIEKVKSFFQVGLDVHTKTHRGYKSRSWAVICVDGKPEYLTFVEFRRNEIQELRNFLRMFKRNNCIVDHPPGMRELFKF